MVGLALQIFAHEVAEIGIHPDSRRGMHLDGALVEDARKRLCRDLVNPPTMTALATEFEVTERALSAGFRKQYGTSAYEILRDERLESARKVILAGNIPLKEIAYQSGYSHPTNFSTAFKRKFGVSPLSFRRVKNVG
jgi:AraC-like DNA-binding protein